MVDKEKERAQAAIRAQRYRDRRRHATVTEVVTEAWATTPSVTGSVTEKLTRGERDDLAKVARLRARTAKSHIAVREAELLADAEAQLAATYNFCDEDWRHITEAAQAAIRAADEQVAEICRQRGIPEQFRPHLYFWWQGRGENAVAGRRAELRKVARANIAAQGRTAKLLIEARESEVLTELLAGGLTSMAAQQYLESIPDPAKLMPPQTIAALEAAAESPRRTFNSDYE